MDAADLKFLPKTFDVCTAFFCLMYIPKNKHLQVFKQVSRVLKDDWKFLLWDLKIPERHADYRTYAIRLKIALPNEQVKTGYGTIWGKTQSLEYFKGLLDYANQRLDEALKQMAKRRKDLAQEKR